MRNNTEIVVIIHSNEISADFDDNRETIGRLNVRQYSAAMKSLDARSTFFKLKKNVWNVPENTAASGLLSPRIVSASLGSHESPWSDWQTRGEHPQTMAEMSQKPIPSCAAAGHTKHFYSQAYGASSGAAERQLSEPTP